MGKRKSKKSLDTATPSHTRRTATRTPLLLVPVSKKLPKKFTGGRVRYVVIPRLGEAFVAEDVTEDDLRAALQTLRA